MTKPLDIETRADVAINEQIVFDKETFYVVEDSDGGIFVKTRMKNSPYDNAFGYVAECMRYEGAFEIARLLSDITMSAQS